MVTHFLGHCSKNASPPPLFLYYFPAIQSTVSPLGERSVLIHDLMNTRFVDYLLYASEWELCTSKWKSRAWFKVFLANLLAARALLETRVTNPLQRNGSFSVAELTFFPNIPPPPFCFYFSLVRFCSLKLKLWKFLRGSFVGEFIIN